MLKKVNGFSRRDGYMDEVMAYEAITSSI